MRHQVRDCQAVQQPRGQVVGGQHVGPGLKWLAGQRRHGQAGGRQRWCGQGRAVAQFSLNALAGLRQRRGGLRHVELRAVQQQQRLDHGELRQ